MRLLISAFEPFGGRRRNTSAEILRQIRLKRLLSGKPVSCQKVLFPVDFDAAWPRLQRKLEYWTPDLVILMGEGKTRPVTLETAARNLRRHSPEAIPIDTERQAIYESAAALRLAGSLPSSSGISIEQDPGDYLCNYLYFQCLSRRPEIPTIFLHVQPLADDYAPADLARTRTLVEETLLLAIDLQRDAAAANTRRAHPV